MIFVKVCHSKLRASTQSTTTYYHFTGSLDIGRRRDDCLPFDVISGRAVLPAAEIDLRIASPLLKR